MRWLKSLFRPARKQDAELEREIAFHIEQLTQANIAGGMTPGEARRQAKVAFGGREQVKQQLREVHASAFIESVSANIKAALRFVRRAPGFSAAIILTLALGVGAIRSRCSARNKRNDSGSPFQRCARSGTTAQKTRRAAGLLVRLRLIGGCLAGW